MSSLASSVLAGALSCLITAALTAGMLRTGFLLSVVDRPNERSLHTKPTPRVGGIPLLLGAVFGATALLVRTPAPTSAALPALGCGVVALALIGALDDRYGLRARIRFLCQVGAAGVSVIVLHPLLSQRFDLLSAAPWLGVVLVIGVTWSANLYNFMDGADGLAGSMAVSGFGVLALIAGLQRATDLGILSAALAGGALGFLPFNWHPARVFMGDVGSVPLGFAASVIGIEGAARGVWPMWTPLVAFWPFAFDASLTLGRRLFRGARVWEAHREHLYQKLVRMGWGHRRTALAEAATMSVCAGLSLLLTQIGPHAGVALVAGLLAASFLCTAWVEARWRAFEAARAATSLPLP